MKIIIDDWQGVLGNEKSFDSNDMGLLVKSIDGLDGINKTLVGLEVDEFVYLSVAGGNDGRYVVTGNKENQIYNLLSKEHVNSDLYVGIIAGGQLGQFKIKYCVDKKAAMQAAEYFYKNKGFDRALMWEIL